MSWTSQAYLVPYNGYLHGGCGATSTSTSKQIGRYQQTIRDTSIRAIDLLHRPQGSYKTSLRDRLRLLPRSLVGLGSSQARAPAKRGRGEHIHHGYFLEPTDTKERAQERLIELLLETSELAGGSSVLDVGCGIGGTSRYLARERACQVTGITISGKQIELAKKETGCQEQQNSEVVNAHSSGFLRFPPKDPKGAVRYLELDAEKMGDFFATAPYKTIFDYVWISEAMSHLPNKKLFFENAYKLLSPNGKLVIADWFKAEGLTAAQEQADIKPIEGKISFAQII